MSDTPKTDKAKFWPSGSESVPCVTAKFAREQERTIAQLVEALKALYNESTGCSDAEINARLKARTALAKVTP